MIPRDDAELVKLLKASLKSEAQSRAEDRWGAQLSTARRQAELTECLVLASENLIAAVRRLFNLRRAGLTFQPMDLDAVEKAYRAAELAIIRYDKVVGS